MTSFTVSEEAMPLLSLLLLLLPLLLSSALPEEPIFLGGRGGTA